MVLGLAGTTLHLDFQVANVKRPIVSAHGFYDAGFTLTLGASSGCALSGPSGETIPVWRRNRTFWLRGQRQNIPREGYIVAGVGR